MNAQQYDVESRVRSLSCKIICKQGASLARCHLEATMLAMRRTYILGFKVSSMSHEVMNANGGLKSL